MGTVEPIESVAVRPQVGGVITHVAFTEGDDVRAGQPLFQIDPRPLQAALEAAQAQLARDEAQAANADAQSDRYAKLAAKDYVTREQADAARTQADVFRAAVQADRAAVEQAKLNLAYATVSSPVAGRTGSILVTKGNVVAPNGGPLVVVNQLSPIRVSFAVPGDRLPQVRKHTAGGALAVHARPSSDGASEALDRPPGLRGQRRRRRHRHRDAEGGVPERRRRALAGAVRGRGPGARDRARRADGARRRRGDRARRPVRLRRGRRPQGREARRRQWTAPSTAWPWCEGDLRDGETVVIDGQMRLVPGAVVEIKTGEAGDRGRAMSLFIRRPVMTTLVMLAILVVGVIGYRQLPVSDLPNVDFPTISVSASLPGASPETMASAVATPLEKQFSTIAGIDNMTSTQQPGLHQRSPSSSASTATSTPPRRTCRRPSPRCSASCRATCRRRRPTRR